MKTVSSWGRLSSPLHDIVSLSSPLQAKPVVMNATRLGLAYGMGRSYGDVCLNPQGTLWMTKGLDHLMSFDPDTGRLVVEAGVLLSDIQRLTLPRGWLLPATPGTQLITVGGAIANDVHGKNHHVYGCFGDHVKHLRLIRTDGQEIDCSPEHNADWFAATVGGLGLTGVILQAEIQLRRVSGPWLHSETLPYANISEFFHLADASEAKWEHTVSWIDCTSVRGRGLFMRANPMDLKRDYRPSSRHLSIPMVPPISLVNRWSLRALNFAYYMKKSRQRSSITHYESFFYPLDHVWAWNRLYGPKGFFQYQSVVPRATGQDAVEAMLKEILRFETGSFLAVLKTFGHRASPGMLSFPQHGVTLALDFPNQGARTQSLFARLDAIVSEAGGRLYPAKDARMPKTLFESGYPRLGEFLAYRDPGISSGFARRVMEE